MSQYSPNARAAFLTRYWVCTQLRYMGSDVLQQRNIMVLGRSISIGWIDETVPLGRSHISMLPSTVL